MAHERRVFFNSASSSIDELKAGRSQPEVLLDESTSRHLIKVLRLEEGDPVTAVHRSSNTECSAILSVREVPCTIKLLAVSESASLAPQPAVQSLIFALGRPQVNDLVCEKATELGVNNLIFWRSERSHPQSSKLERWEKIAASASSQSGRSAIPQVNYCQGLDDLWQLLDNSVNSQDRLLCCALSPRAVSARKLRRLITPVHLLIGPAGDLTEGELTALEKRGFELLSLGPCRLRSETAAITAIAMVQAVSEFPSND